MCGASPTPVAAFTSAPLSSSSRAKSRWPSEAPRDAQIRAVHPSCRCTHHDQASTHCQGGRFKASSERGQRVSIWRRTACSLRRS
jgi:hypothetical protein